MLVGVEPGSELAGYRIERVLAAGGMGTVYLAHDPVLPRFDALKVLSTELSKDPSLRERFTRESDTGAALHHPNIVSIYSRGEAEDGQLWIAMQYVAGTDAEAALAAGAMTPARGLRIVREVAKALDYAHRLNVVHHDVKPSNILLANDIDSDDEHVLLSDFGISRVIGQADTTGDAPLTLSLAYAAPEAIAGSAIDGSADIYSLGCTLFRLLTNKHVFSQADGTSALVEAHLRQVPPRISDFLSGSSPQLDSVIAKALAKDPDQRFNSAREFAAAATDALHHALPYGGTPHEMNRDSATAIGTDRPAARASTPESPRAAGSTTGNRGHIAGPRQSSPAPPMGGWAHPGRAPRHFGPASRGMSLTDLRGRARLVWVVAATAAVIALVAGLIHALTRSFPPAELPAAPPPSPVQPAPIKPDPSAQARLLTLLPRGYPPGTCSPGGVTSRSTATMLCGLNTDPGGPTSAVYTIARDTTALKTELDGVVHSAAPAVCPPNILSPGPWHRVETPTVSVGLVFCGIRFGKTLVAWTNEPERLLCETEADAGGPPLDQLFGWWASHS